MGLELTRGTLEDPLQLGDVARSLAPISSVPFESRVAGIAKPAFIERSEGGPL